MIDGQAATKYSKLIGVESLSVLIWYMLDFSEGTFSDYGNEIENTRRLTISSFTRHGEESVPIISLKPEILMGLVYNKL